MTKVENVKISELLALLSQINLYCSVVDIIVDPKEKRVIINPVEDLPKNPDKVKLEGNIDDII
jgi:hypothetical protein